MFSRRKWLCNFFSRSCNSPKIDNISAKRSNTYAEWYMHKHGAIIVDSTTLFTPLTSPPPLVHPALFFITAFGSPTSVAIVNLLRAKKCVNVRIDRAAAGREKQGGITQILISTVEINARSWSLINARDSSAVVQLSPRRPADGLGRFSRYCGVRASIFLSRFSFSLATAARFVSVCVNVPGITCFN